MRFSYADLSQITKSLDAFQAGWDAAFSFLNNDADEDADENSDEEGFWLLRKPPKDDSFLGVRDQKSFELIRKRLARFDENKEKDKLPTQDWPFGIIVRALKAKRLRTLRFRYFKKSPKDKKLNRFQRRYQPERACAPYYLDSLGNDCFDVRECLTPRGQLKRNGR